MLANNLLHLTEFGGGIKFRSETPDKLAALFVDYGDDVGMSRAPYDIVRVKTLFPASYHLLGPNNDTELI